MDYFDKEAEVVRETQIKLKKANSANKKSQTDKIGWQYMVRQPNFFDYIFNPPDQSKKSKKNKFNISQDLGMFVGK